MNDVWLKIKVWTKGIVFGAVLLYVVLFIYYNSGDHIQFWWWFRHEHQTSAIVLALSSFAAGAVCLLLIETTLRTLRQMRDVRAGRRLDKLEREQDAIRAKAAMLQTHSTAAGPEGVTVRVDQLGGN